MTVTNALRELVVQAAEYGAQNSDEVVEFVTEARAGRFQPEADPLLEDVRNALRQLADRATEVIPAAKNAEKQLQALQEAVAHFVHEIEWTLRDTELPDDYSGVVPHGGIEAHHEVAGFADPFEDIRELRDDIESQLLSLKELPGVQREYNALTIVPQIEGLEKQPLDITRGCIGADPYSRGYSRRKYGHRLAERETFYREVPHVTNQTGDPATKDREPGRQYWTFKPEPHVSEEEARQRVEDDHAWMRQPTPKPHHSQREGAVELLNRESSRGIVKLALKHALSEYTLGDS